MSESDGNRDDVATIELPDKTYFKIGEVAKLLEVEPYVLRYWETEFDVLEPEKTKSGQRVYQRADIELLFQIRTLLYEEMFTIAGACRQIERRRKGKSSYFDLDESAAPQTGGTAVADDSELREELESARQQLTASQSELSDLRQEASSLREERDEAQEARDELRQEASSLREERDEAVEERDELREEVRHQRQTVEKLEDRVQELNTRIGEQQQQLEERQQQLSRLQSRRDELQSQIDILEQRVESEAGPAADPEQVEALQSEIAELQQRLEASQQQADRKRRALERTIRDRRKERSQLLDSLRSEVQSLETLAQPDRRSAR